jgi:hypothetical protein
MSIDGKNVDNGSDPDIFRVLIIYGVEGTPLTSGMGEGGSSSGRLLLHGSGSPTRSRVGVGSGELR